MLYSIYRKESELYMIEKQNLEKGSVYLVNSPNFNVAVWDGEAFIGAENEGGTLNSKALEHYSDGLPLGICSPIQKLSDFQLKFPINTRNILILLNILSEQQGAMQ